MSSKDPSEVPPQAAEPAPVASKAASSEAEWPRLLARVVEAIVSAELHEFEENVKAFLDSAFADASATFVWICARLIGVGFLLTGLILFMGVWLQWWAAFALAGLAVIAVGSLASAMQRPHRRRSYR